MIGAKAYYGALFLRLKPPINKLMADVMRAVITLMISARVKRLLKSNKMQIAR